MLTKKIICLLITVSTLSSFAQQNITFSPEKPKPGETITVTYEPAGDIANTILPVEAIVYQKGKTKQKADDLMLEKSGRKFTGSTSNSPRRSARRISMREMVSTFECR